jgi:hypothetical protein
LLQGLKLRDQISLWDNEQKKHFKRTENPPHNALGKTSMGPTQIQLAILPEKKETTLYWRVTAK